MSILEYNRMKTEGITYLKTCFDGNARSGGFLIGWGTLSHSHLLLVLLCYATEAQWDFTEHPVYPCGPHGRLDTSTVTKNDRVLEELPRGGLEMEVLSYEIYLQEPQACILISNAMNSPHKAALRSTELHAMATLSGEILLHIDPAVAGSVCYETVKEKAVSYTHLRAHET